MRRWPLWCGTAPERPPATTLPDTSTRLLQLHTIVTPPLTASGMGRIECHPDASAAFPIAYVWSPEPAALDDARACALQASVGAYTVVATDAQGAQAAVRVEVRCTLPAAAVVTGYQTTPASGSRVRDGTVQACGDGLDEHDRFLWSNGVETAGPVLRDVPCGTYVVVALPHGGRAVTTVHTCHPAVVSVRVPSASG